MRTKGIWGTRGRTPGKDSHQISRWQSAHDSTHDEHDLLASRRHADVGAAVHGNALRKVAGLLQG